MRSILVDRFSYTSTIRVGSARARLRVSTSWNKTTKKKNEDVLPVSYVNIFLPSSFQIQLPLPPPSYGLPSLLFPFFNADIPRDTRGIRIALMYVCVNVCTRLLAEYEVVEEILFFFDSLPNECIRPHPCCRVRDSVRHTALSRGKKKKLVLLNR